MKWLGMTDWRLSQLHASCPRPYPPSAALLFPLQPSFDRKQEASRLDSALSWVCSAQSNDTNCCPLVHWQLKNNWLSGFFWICWSTLEIPAHFHGMLNCLFYFFHELILPSSSTAAARHLALHWWTTVQLPRRHDQVVSRVGSTFFTMEIAGSCSD